MIFYIDFMHKVKRSLFLKQLNIHKFNNHVKSPAINNNNNNNLSDRSHSLIKFFFLGPYFENRMITSLSLNKNHVPYLLIYHVL